MGRSLQELASYMRPLAEELLKRAAAVGLDPFVEDTGRTPDEQRIKVAQNVSWTLRSKHLPQPPENLSEAIDVAPRSCMALKYWGWLGRVDNSSPLWLQLGLIGEGLGLEWGGRWTRVPGDPAHFQFSHGQTPAHVDNATSI